MNRVFIIAEAGVNHNGDINLAKKLIDEAKKAGADAVKFQTFKAKNLASKDAKQAKYQEKNIGKSEDQQSMLKKLELSYEEFKELASYCKKIGIEFMSTAFDFESIEFLKSLDMKMWKVPSGEITNLPYLEKIAGLNLPVIISTGMSTMNDVRAAVKIFEEKNSRELTILHCTTEYPAPFNEVNLNAMVSLEREFSYKVGYSDHTMGIEVPIAAVAMGARMIEKHFTLDRNMEGPDHKASLEPQELSKMVSSIRNVEKALGNGVKEPSDSEMKNREVARKSIVAKGEIKEGEIFSSDNLTTKRPGNGISPMKWYEIIGMKAKRDFMEDELIEI